MSRSPLLIALGFAVAACGSERELQSCEQPLGGAYRSDSGARAYVVDEGIRVLAYEVPGAEHAADTSPAWFELTRRPAGMDGFRHYRLRSEGMPCEVREQATVVSCARGLTISHEVAARAPGAACATRTTDKKTITLRRTRGYRL